MFQQNLKLENANYIGNLIKEQFDSDQYSYQFENHTLFCQADKVFPTIEFLKERCNFIVLLDICGVDNIGRPEDEWDHGKRFEVVYHLLNMEIHQRIRVRVPIDERRTIPSVVPLWKGADWFERETWDMFGIEFENREMKRLLTHNQFNGHPLRKDFDTTLPQVLEESEEIFFEEDPLLSRIEREKREWVNLGPCHPATRGTLRVMLELEGETITRSKLEIGYLHRCFEKICETKKYNQIIPYTDRLNYCSAPMNNIGWCKAVEDMMGIEIPDRAKALRMIFAELSRIIDHLLCIGASAVDLGATSNFHFCFEQRERVYELIEKLSGARVTASLTRIGGMAYDLPIGWVNDCLKTTKAIAKNIDEIDKSLSRSKIWMDRTRVCPVSAKDALEWGYTGPCLRACGVNYDIRKASPYYYYSDVDFEIPLGINGDCYDRYLVRVEEMRQSLKIVAQVLDNLPTGRVTVEDPSISLPKKNELYTNFESMSQHTNIIGNGIIPNSGEIYSCTEAANGELGFYIVSDGSNKPFRVKVRPPCFSIYQSFSEVVKKSMISDAVATLGSMNIVAGELDR